MKEFSQAESIYFLAYYSCKVQGIDRYNESAYNGMKRIAGEEVNLKEYFKLFDELLNTYDNWELIRKNLLNIDHRLYRKAVICILEVIISIETLKPDAMYFLMDMCNIMLVPNMLVHYANTIFGIKYAKV